MAYRLHSNHDTVPVEKQVMRYVSIDPGQNNFVIRIEKRIGSAVTKLCSRVVTLEQDKHVINFENKRTSWITELHSVLDGYSQYYPEVDIALIERQMPINTRMKCMESVIASYFILKYPHIVVVDLSSKMKAKIFGADKLKHTELKKWSPKLANKLTRIRRDTKYTECIADRVKVDDDADSLVQIEAFVIYVGYASTI